LILNVGVRFQELASAGRLRTCRKPPNELARCVRRGLASSHHELGLHLEEQHLGRERPVWEAAAMLGRAP
jgi:hypothetical protein